MNIDGASILARGIAAEGPGGTVFENVDLGISSGSLAVVVGRAGSGRTSLLLAMSGRLPLVAGYLEVSGYFLPEEADVARDLLLPARLRPGFELERTHRVRDAARERRMLTGVSAAVVQDSFGVVGFDHDPATLIGDLDACDQLLLAIALAAAEAPSGILVDDVDEGLNQADRDRVWDALLRLTETGMTVVASATDPLPDATVVPLPCPYDWLEDVR